MGKSSIIDMLLGKMRDLTRNSTPFAMEPIHLQLVPRDVSNQRLNANWECVDYGRLSGMIAYTSNKLFKGTEFQKGKGKDGRDGREDESEGGEEESHLASPLLSTSVSSAVHKAAPKREFSNATSRFFKLGQVFQKSQKLHQQESVNEPQRELASISTTLDNDPDNITKLFSDFLDGLHSKVLSSKEVGELLMSHSVRLIDSGGQPQFLELVSIFLSHISGFISVFKLSESLSDHGEVQFYKQGELTNEPYKSHYSHEQVIRHDLQVIQSEAAHRGV